MFKASRPLWIAHISIVIMTFHRKPYSCIAQDPAPPDLLLANFRLNNMFPTHRYCSTTAFRSLLFAWSYSQGSRGCPIAPNGRFGRPFECLGGKLPEWFSAPFATPFFLWDPEWSSLKPLCRDIFVPISTELWCPNIYELNAEDSRKKIFTTTSWFRNRNAVPAGLMGLFGSRVSAREPLDHWWRRRWDRGICSLGPTMSLWVRGWFLAVQSLVAYPSSTTSRAPT